MSQAAKVATVVGIVAGVAVVIAAAVPRPVAAQSGDRRIVTLSGRAAGPLFNDVLAGDTLYLSGRLGLDPQTGQPPVDPAQEARNVLEATKAVLAEAGMTMDDLVQVQVFCTDLNLYDAFNTVYRTYFTGPPPARAFLGAGSLLRGARFEVMGIAVRR